jgi:tetratricopeptide (TPR) repeat protein
MLAKGDLQGAENEVDSLRKQYPDSNDIRSLHGTVMLAKRQPAKAREIFAEVLRSNPTSIDGYSGVVTSHLMEGHTAQARAVGEEALKKMPRDPAVLVLNAKVARAAGDSAKTEQLLRRAIDADAGAFEAYSMLGDLYFSEKKLDAARQQFDQIAAQRPRDVGARTIAGMMVETQGNVDEARKRYEQVLQIDPNAAVAANNLAWLYAEHGGNLDIALQLAQTASHGAPQVPEVSDTLGWVYYKKNLAGLAIQSFTETVQRSPQNAIFHYHLGLAYAKNGEKDKARTALQRALALNASFPGADDARRQLETLQAPTR